MKLSCQECLVPVVAFALIVCFVVAGYAQTEPPKKRQRFTYKAPPGLGAPSNVRTAGTRGTLRPLPKLWIIAPPGDALTARPDPTVLVIQQDTDMQDGGAAIRLLLSIGPEGEVKNHWPAEKGPLIRRIRFADRGLKLDEKIDHYELSLSAIAAKANVPLDQLRPEPEDPEATAAITFRKPKADVQEKIDRSSGLDRARILLEHHYWYDAVDELWTMIEKDPDNTEAREALMELLMSCGPIIEQMKDAPKARELELQKNIQEKVKEAVAALAKEK